MARQVSCTATVGAGSEVHNHSIEYRKILDHTDTANRPDAIIELIPYRPYKEKINELMKPYIDQYNARVEQRFQSNLERYKQGEIKSRPKRKDYKPMGYDYYEEHLHDTHTNPHTKKVEKLPMWREIIIGLGDQNDRKTGMITRDEAVAVLRDVVRQWPEMFPDFKLLGATVHLDEAGFYHAHLDYKPLYEKTTPERGLSVGIGHDAALEHMGYEPEQSIINERDKAPIRFNAFRNRLYLEVEQALNERGLRLQYGVSAVKEPGKDSSTNQQLEAWKASQEATRGLQRQKNAMLDIIMADHVSPDGYKAAVQAADDVRKALEAVESSPMSRLSRNKVVVEFRLLDQLKSFVAALMDTVAHLFKYISSLDERCRSAESTVDRLHREMNRKDEKIEWYENRTNELLIEVSQYSQDAKENQQRKDYMARFNVGSVGNSTPMEQDFQNELNQQRHRSWEWE